MTDRVKSKLAKIHNVIFSADHKYSCRIYSVQYNKIMLFTPVPEAGTGNSKMIAVIDQLSSPNCLEEVTWSMISF